MPGACKWQMTVTSCLHPINGFWVFVSSLWTSIKSNLNGFPTLRFFNVDCERFSHWYPCPIDQELDFHDEIAVLLPFYDCRRIENVTFVQGLQIDRNNSVPISEWEKIISKVMRKVLKDKKTYPIVGISWLIRHDAIILTSYNSWSDQVNE